MANSASHILSGRARALCKLKGSSVPKDSNTSQFILIFAIACIGFVGILAPEKPNQVASICEKYNSVTACKIW